MYTRSYVSFDKHEKSCEPQHNQIQSHSFTFHSFLVPFIVISSLNLNSLQLLFL